MNALPPLLWVLAGFVLGLLVLIGAVLLAVVVLRYYGWLEK
jgi:hypothetical protein